MYLKFLIPFYFQKRILKPYFVSLCFKYTQFINIYRCKIQMNIADVCSTAFKKTLFSSRNVATAMNKHILFGYL